jgi:hypothetical protein
MTQQERKGLWDALLAEGWSPTKHYREHSVQELQDQLVAVRAAKAQTKTETSDDSAAYRIEAEIDALREVQPDTVPGLRLNTHGEDKPLRIDADGKIWYKDEIGKPATPVERGKRILDYVDPGVKTVHVRDSNGSVVESFEMPGDQKRIAQAKVSLPAYQTGLYRDPALLGEFFRIHVYRGKQVFDLFDVQKYFGGPRAVPATCKRDYTDTVLGYDIESVLQAIQDEYREKLKNGEL